jgi:hypothetical protein
MCACVRVCVSYTHVRVRVLVRERDGVSGRACLVTEPKMPSANSNTRREDDYNWY